MYKKNEPTNITYNIETNTRETERMTFIASLLKKYEGDDNVHNERKDITFVTHNRKAGN